MIVDISPLHIEVHVAALLTSPHPLENVTAEVEDVATNNVAGDVVLSKDRNRNAQKGGYLFTVEDFLKESWNNSVRGVGASAILGNLAHVLRIVPLRWRLRETWRCYAGSFVFKIRGLSCSVREKCHRPNPRSPSVAAVARWMSSCLAYLCVC